MRNKFFLAYGYLIWLQSKIAGQILLVLLFLANVGAMVDIVDTDTHFGSPAQEVVVLVDAQPDSAESQQGDVPDPEPPTTASDWSEMVRVVHHRPDE